MTRNKLRLAIVGAGPAGIYAADILLKAERNFDVSIDLFDHLPAPYGLVRYGVAPDHPRIKGIITALRPRSPGEACSSSPVQSSGPAQAS